MFFRIFGTIVASLMAVSANAGILNEADFGEFSDVFDSPTDFTGYSSIFGTSNGRTDFEYFWFESLLAGTTSLDFSLKNAGSGSNMLIRLSASPFTMPEWDWKIDELDAGNMQGRELYTNEWLPEDTYSYSLPDGFDGPLYGFARFYGTNSASSFSINAIGASAIPVEAILATENNASSSVPLTGTLSLVIAALGAFIGAGAIRRSRSA